ncbi:nucleotidyltransferase domain-containing protein [Microbacterium sp. KHB019]|uniref:nucleotidyltransferase domain-containing protein n=1 Tax=Microbacterium sp. KHB019 TaxID=3129770 RepID=UPI003079151B
MTTSAATAWEPLSTEVVAELLAKADVRWWLSGGAALDRWLGRSIRERTNIDVSVLAADLAALVASLPAGYSAWAPSGEDDEIVVFEDAPQDADLQPVLIRDDAKDAWVLQVNAEDGAPRAWVYKRDPRLTLPWDRAVLDVDGIPTGAPEVQLVWKALRPRSEDTADKDAVLPHLDEAAVSFYETALLRIHPHSTWAIHVRSPFAPAKASWNRKKP